MAEQKRTKTFKMDVGTERRLVSLSDLDKRSQPAEVRHLINTEWERRRLQQVRASMMPELAAMDVAEVKTALAVSSTPDAG